MRGCFFVFFVIFLAFMHEIKAEPVCQVQSINGEYIGSIISDVKRVPKTPFKLKIPAKTPIAMDSYFNSCIVHPDHTPVAGTTVVLYGEDGDWNVTTKTAVTGCFNMTIPSDVNFSIKAINPDGGKWSYYRAFITSAKKGTLLDDPKDHVFPFDNDLINTAKMSAEPGFKLVHQTYNSFKGTANLKVNKHSMVISFPSKVGVKYVVSFKSDKQVWVYFSDNTRKNHNPAKLNGGGNKIINLDPLTATKTSTRLYFQSQKSGVINITELSIKAEVSKPKPHARANTCVPFGDKHYKNDRKKVHGKWVTTVNKSTYWRKCRRSKTDWPNG